MSKEIRDFIINSKLTTKQKIDLLYLYKSSKEFNTNYLNFEFVDDIIKVLKNNNDDENVNLYDELANLINFIKNS